MIGDSLRSLIEKHSDSHVCGEAVNGVDALHKERELWHAKRSVMISTHPKVGGGSCLTAMGLAGTMYCGDERSRQ